MWYGSHTGSTAGYPEHRRVSSGSTALADEQRIRQGIRRSHDGRSANSILRPQDRADVALYYAAASPAQVFNQAAQQVAVQEGGTLSENARAFALMNMAISDSLVASFFNKYHYNVWRPETAVHGGDTDANDKTDPDPDYVPFIVTPCFPSYPSNHGSAANAASEVLRRLYGESAHPMTLSNTAVPNIVLQYTSSRQISDDISGARVYGGIHFERTTTPARFRDGRYRRPCTRTTSPRFSPTTDRPTCTLLSAGSGRLLASPYPAKQTAKISTGSG